MDFQKYLEFQEELKKRPMNIYEYSAWGEAIHSANTWGGKREGAGRKRQGITKKVSLTLTEDEWDYIKGSGAKTVGEYIKRSIRTSREAGDCGQQVDGTSERVC